MSESRETVSERDFQGDVAGVDSRRADIATEQNYFQHIDGIMPWEEFHRRMFGKRVMGKMRGIDSDNTPVITIHTLPGNHTIYQTRAGLIMDTQAVSFPTVASLSGRYRASSLAASNNDLISSFTDISGNGRHLVAAGSERPTYKINIFGGRPALRFDGVANQMIGPAISNFLTAGKGTVIIAFKATTISTNAPTVYQNDALWSDHAQGYAGLHLKSDNTLHSYSFNGSTTDVATVYPVGTTGMAIWQHDGANLYVGNNTSSLVPAAAIVPAVLAGGFKLGSTYPSLEFFEGYIAEVVICNSAISAAELDSILAYLNYEYP